MSKQYPGGIVSKTPVTPTSLSAPGIWTMNQQAAAQATNTWPFPRDPQFKNVTMLLHGDGSAGPVAATGVGAGVSTTVPNFNADASTNNFNVTINGDARSNNFTPYQEGYYSYSGNGSTTYALAPNSTAFDQNAAFTLEWYDFLISNGAAQAPFYVNTSGYLTVYRQAAGGYQLDRSGTGSLYLSSAYSFSAWHYIAISYDGTNTRFYVDGVLLYTYAGGGVACGTTPELGRGNGGINVNGYISNLRFTKSALYTGSTMTVPTTPLTAIANCTFLAFQSNRFIDNSASPLTITTFNSPAISPAVPFTLPSTVATYGSGYFDGTGDYLTVPDNAVLDMGSSDFTIEGWVYITATSGSLQTLVAKGTGADNQASYHIALNGSTWVYYLSGTGSTWSIASGVTIGTYTINTWQHVALVRSGSTFTPYLNGVAGTTTTSATALFDSNKVFSIGASDAGTALLTGYISNCRAVKGTAVYTSAFTPPTAPLTAITNTSLLTTQYNGGGNNSGFKDSSQFNFPITRNGNTTQGTFTPYGSNWSNYFGGSQSLSNGTNITASGDFTLECWLNLSSYSAARIFFSVGNETANRRAFFIDSSGVIKIDLASVGATSLGGSVPTNTWTHLAVTRSSNTVTAYVNGVATGTTATISGTFGNANGFYVGSVSDNSNSMVGYISNLRWVLGSVVYTSAFTPSTTPLTAITNTSLLTCQSNRFVDNSSNAFAITVNSTPSVQRFSPFAPLTVYNPTTYGGSAYFDGSSANLITTNTITTIGTQDFCLEAWVYAFSTTDYACIIGNDTAGGGAGWFIEMGTARGIFIAGPEVSLGSAQYNRWFHVVFCRVSNTYGGFVNGVRQATGSLTTNYSTAVKIGINSYVVGTLNKGTTGYIADGRVTIGSSPYSPSSTTLTVPTAPLTAVTGTVYLASMTNAAILDNGMMNDLQTVGNAAVSTSVKKYGAASMVFDGTGDYLVSNPATTDLYAYGGDFTIELWLYRNATGQTILVDSRPSGGGGASAYYVLYVNTSNVVTWITAGSVRITGTTTIANSTWYHLAVSRSGSSTKLFVNGTQEGSTYTNSTALICATGRPYIGVDANDLTSALNGNIDDLRITKGVARYTTTFTVPDQAFPNG